MKKPHYLLLSILLLSAATKAQTNWVTQKLDGNITLKFPVAPLKTTTNGTDVYTIRQPDSLAYSAGMLDFNTAVHVDSAMLAPVKDTQPFADQLKAGMASKKTNYTFGAMTIGKWKAYTSYTVTGIENTTKNTLYMEMILIGSKMYTLSCRVPVGMSTKNNEVFFAAVEKSK